MPVLKYRDPADGLFKDLVAAGGGSNEVTIAGTTPVDPMNELWVDTTASTPVYDWSVADNRYLTSGFRNMIRNGDMSIAQRGDGPYVSLTNLTDGWLVAAGGGTTSVTRVTPAAGSGSKVLSTVISGQSAAADYVAIFQRIEDVETFSGKTVTLSFDAYAATGTPKIGVEWEQFFGTGGSTAVRAAVSAIPIGTSRNRYSITFTFPPISGKTVVAGSYLRAIFWLSAGADNASKASSIGIQNNTFYITDVQLEAGAAASPFERLPVQQQLAWCQRYFQRWNTPSLRGVMTSATLAARLGMVLPVQMRTLPSASISGSIYVYDGAATATISSLGTAYWDTKAGAIEFNSTIGSSLTVGRPAITLLDNTSSAYLDLSAEL